MIIITSCFDFLCDTTKKMLSTKPTNQGWSNWVVGLSSFSYLAPAITIWCLTMDIRDSALYEFTLYVIVSCNSFIADYIMTGKISIWHMLDRWTATAGFIISAIKPIVLSFTLFDLIVFGMIGFPGVYCLRCSRKAKSPNKWRMYHIGWHFAGGLIMSYLVYVEHLNVNQIQHPFQTCIIYLFQTT
eukprot:267682_1